MKSQTLSIMTQKFSDEELIAVLPELTKYVDDLSRSVMKEKLCGASDITIYTDGGCFPNPGRRGAWAAIFEDGKETREHYGVVTSKQNSVSNIQMEMTAVCEALKVLTEPRHIVIHSDLNHVIQGMSEWKPKWQSNGYKASSGKPVAHADLWKEIHKSQDFHKSVSVHWVKAHSGARDHISQMNKKADELVRFAFNGI